MKFQTISKKLNFKKLKEKFQGTTMRTDTDFLTEIQGAREQGNTDNIMESQPN